MCVIYILAWSRVWRMEPSHWCGAIVLCMLLKSLQPSATRALTYFKKGLYCQDNATWTPFGMPMLHGLRTLNRVTYMYPHSILMSSMHAAQGFPKGADQELVANTSLNKMRCFVSPEPRNSWACHY